MTNPEPTTAPPSEQALPQAPQIPQQRVPLESPVVGPSGPSAYPYAYPPAPQYPQYPQPQYPQPHYPPYAPQYPPQPGGYSPYQPWAVQLPTPPRRPDPWPALIAALVVSAMLALGAIWAAVTSVRPSGGDQETAASTWVDVRPEVGGKAIDEVLKRHTDAVKRKDLSAWLADVDQSDAAFVKRQKQEFENLTKMPFEELTFERSAVSAPKLAGFLPSQLFDRYHAAVRVIAVTVHHKIQGVDTKSVATPWLAVFGLSHGKWVIAGDGAGKNLPTGTEGQPWDSAGPITVTRNDRVVAVLSGDNAESGRNLLSMAETGLQQVAQVRPSGWDGKVLLTAVTDKRIFDTYFAESQDRVAQVAAIAVPYYGEVPEWTARPAYATTRVVFNPTELSAPRGELQHDLTHEFTHAAMGPVTGPYTPRWVVEGFAEYVAYKDGKYNAAGIRQALGDLTIGAFPTDQQFYDEPRNYIGGWLACRMIAETYGEAKLIAFYEAFMRLSETESVAKEVLGVGQIQLEQQWKDFVDKQRK